MTGALSTAVGETLPNAGDLVLHRIARASSNGSAAGSTAGGAMSPMASLTDMRGDADSPGGSSINEVSPSAAWVRQAGFAKSSSFLPVVIQLCS